MINLFHCLSPNVLKIMVFLEEAELDYRITSIDISKGEHLSPEFLTVSLNAKLPAILDEAPADGGAPFAVFESGAILQYLAEKTGRFLPPAGRDRSEVMQWLFWQMANLGPISGQNRHFRNYAAQLSPGFDPAYPIDRYTRETNRLYGALDRRLAGRDHIAGGYSIADMACYPWIRVDELGQDLADFPHLSRWFEKVGARPPVVRAYERNREVAAATVGLARYPYPWEGLKKHSFLNTAEIYAKVPRQT